MPSVNIPFPGFYHTVFSEALDWAEEQNAEHTAERRNDGVAPELRITADEVSEIFFRVTDYSVAHDHVAREYATAFGLVVKDELGIELGLAFEEMTSPREYNFETDRIFATVTDDAVAALFAKSAADQHATLAAVIRERFTSRSGFISFYSNDLGEWLAKPLAEWEHNELGTLLIACLRLGDVKSYEDECLDRLHSCGDFDSALDAAIDWPRFHGAIGELAADKLEAVRERAPEYVPPTPRCPDTGDLFERPGV